MGCVHCSSASIGLLNGKCNLLCAPWFGRLKAVFRDEQGYELDFLIECSRRSSCKAGKSSLFVILTQDNLHFKFPD